MTTPEGTTPTTRTLMTEAIARVEGEGALHVEVVDGELTEVRLRIYEPPRFFEGLLRGRSYTEPPDLTARICGICPVAYQMSACVALEDACGVAVEPAIADLRRLLYCGEWIESHVLHIHLLHAPDFLGVPSVVEMAATHRHEVERALELKKLGNELLGFLGGRAIHPVNVALGGFHRAPRVDEVRSLRPAMARALELADEVVDFVAALAAPDAVADHELVCLDDGDRYPVFGSRVVSSGGLSIDIADFGDHVEEFQVPHSTAKHARLLERGRYLVGPLARYALRAETLAPEAVAAARRVGLDPSVRNPFASIVVRAVEVVHACATALAIIDRYAEPERSHVPVPPRAAIGHGASEAPRGLLYHRYEIDAAGVILAADIVPPTSQNQPAIERELTTVVGAHLHLPDDELRHLAEIAIRNHDPCISCATHFLDLRVTRR